MSSSKLFKVNGNGVVELEGQSVSVERSLQEMIEKNMTALLGVRFLASEYSTGKTHAGRIDSLGIDENGCPVIVEYKRSLNENVINQGLFYLDWLLDHRGEFELLVLKKYGKESADAIDWSSPRLICIAGAFTRYDAHAVQQINRNIELIRYKRYDVDLLLLEKVNAVVAEPTPLAGNNDVGATSEETIPEKLKRAPAKVRDLYEALRSFLLGLGDDVQERVLKYYFAFARIKNFACVLFGTRDEWLAIYVKTDPASVPLREGFTRDVTNIGHHGAGNLEIVIRSMEDLEEAKPLLAKSYEAN